MPEMTTTEYGDALKELTMSRPPTVPQLYQQAKPNETIRLYEGPVTVSQEATNVPTSALIEFGWAPSPRVRVTFEDPSAQLTVGAASLMLGSGPNCAIVITDAPKGSEPGLVCRAIAADSIESEERGEAIQVSFHIANLPEFRGTFIRDEAATRSWAGRLEYFANEWQVCVDQSADFDRTVAAQLRSAGGYMISHRGILRRKDGAAIDITAATEQSRVLASVLSFYRGAWTAPFLFTGIDKEGKEVWHVWNSPRISPWMVSQQNWGRDVEPKHALFRLHEALLGHWSEVLPLAIHWYVEANNDTLAESSIVQSQIALELLSWEVLVARERTLSKGGYSKLSAADNFRLAMSSARIPLALPSALSDLETLVKPVGEEVSDAAGAFTFVRNAIVHPDEKKRVALNKAPQKSRKQARALGLWLVEMLILSAVKYDYSYSDRLGDFKQRQMPWVSSRD